MNIGIDIDGVLSDIREFALQYGVKYCKEVNKGKLVNPNAYDTRDAFGWDDETDNNFWSKYLFLYATEFPAIEGASEKIRKIKEEKNNIFILTARCYPYKGGQNAEEKMKQTVKEWLLKNNIIYDRIFFTKEDKTPEVIENKIDIMVDDSPYNVVGLAKVTNVICYNQPYNESIIGEKIHRCYNWNEVYDYIKNYKG